MEMSAIVHIVCAIEVINHSSVDQTIQITGLSQEDVAGGLLVTSNLAGYNAENRSDTFQISANSNCVLTVDFCGEYAGVLQKADRLIPDVIEVTTVK